MLTSNEGQNAGAAPKLIRPATAPPGERASLIETETVMVSDVAAFPTQITRGPGKFFLQIINGAKHSSVNLVLESPTVAVAQLASLDKATNLRGFSHAKHTVGVFDASTGEYHLKSQGTGKILCVITLK